MKLITVGLGTKRALDQHRQEWAKCQKCEIGAIAFKHVLGRGRLPCDVLFLGEAPGKSEDVLGDGSLEPTHAIQIGRKSKEYTDQLGYRTWKKQLLTQNCIYTVKKQASQY